MSNSVIRRITKLEEEIGKAKEELDQINNLVNLFPDLEIKTDRWGNVRFSAESANTQVTDFYTSHSCGCCPDSPLFAYPYITIENIKIHSSPERFYIGEKSDFLVSGNRYDVECLPALRKVNISEQICKKIEEIVTAEPEYIDDDDDFI